MTVRITAGRGVAWRDAASRRRCGRLTAPVRYEVEVGIRPPTGITDRVGFPRHYAVQGHRYPAEWNAPLYLLQGICVHEDDVACSAEGHR